MKKTFSMDCNIMIDDYIYQYYYQSINSKHGTEQTYRVDLENLINKIISHDSDLKEIIIIHEPSREEGLGAPDFRLEKSSSIIGYIETKEIESDLEKIIKTEQIKRYLKFIPNLLLTNYHEFFLFKDGNEQPLKKSTLFDCKKKSSKLEHIKIDQVHDIIKLFLLSPPLQISDTRKLAYHLAERAKILKEQILNLLKSNNKTLYLNKLHGLFESFKDILIESLDYEEFADACAQTVTYSIFLAFLQSKGNIVSKDISSLIPESYPVLKDFFDIIIAKNKPQEMDWILKELLHLVNNINLEVLQERLIFRKYELEDSDPYIYFYETFLSQFDYAKRKAKGVYYTPLPVVRYIVLSLDILLKRSFNKQGFSDSTITALDFATGTGTFLVEVFRNILENYRGDIKPLVKEHLMKNFYGFEYLVAPYAVAHLKLMQVLRYYGYELKHNSTYRESERLKVFLTDTLDNADHKISLLLPSLADEDEAANKIKTTEKILVILGNPPYNNRSRNTKKWIKDLIEIYKPGNEKKLNLDDDYIKFIRFAHYKMENVEQGAIGIITNNSFINGITHRKMRKELLKTFDEIYIFNLHGSSRHEETSPSGEKDENVFDIMQGVSISLMLKTSNSKNKESQIFYAELFGKRESKFKYLNMNSIKTTEWQILSSIEFDKEFNNTKWGKKLGDLRMFIPMKQAKHIKDYGEFWGMTDIFKEWGSGIKSDRDDLVVDFEKKKLEERMIKAFSGNYDKEFIDKYKVFDSSSYPLTKRLKDYKYIESSIINIIYRPFDLRKIYYHIGVTSRPGFEVMKQVIDKKNVVIAFPRQVKKDNFPTFISEFPVDGGLLSEWTYLAPLYLYDYGKEDDDNQEFSLIKPQEKQVNFSADFRTFIKDRYITNPSPEEIIGYIYAILYCPTYREKYNEFLKIDFPRIPFINIDSFKKLSMLGQELIEYHLLNKICADNNIAFYNKTDKDAIIDDVFYSNNRIYIAKDKYFESVNLDIWEYTIGGYQILDKWLKARKNRVLSFKEIEIFKKIAFSIGFTIKQEKRIDSEFNGSIFKIK